MKQASFFLVFMLTLFSISGYKSIFHVELENHINSNNNEVTNNGLNIENILIEQFPIELDLISGEYRAIWNEGYKYDIPILINNLNDLEEFLSNHPAQSANEDILQKNYNDEFFIKILYMLLLKVKGVARLNLL